MDECEVLLAFGCEGVNVAGFYGITKFDKADGVMALYGFEASWCEEGGRRVLLIGCICETVDDEHIGPETVAVCIGSVRKNPLRNPCGVYTSGQIM